jgi:hypothetical protein
MSILHDDDSGYDRRNNDGIYHKIDSLESKIFQAVNGIQENQAKLNEKINILNYKVAIINDGLKIVLGVVAVTLVGAILKNILVG